MSPTFVITCCLTTLSTVSLLAADASGTGAPAAAIPLREVRITGGFWAQRQAMLVESALPHAFDKARCLFEDFARAGGLMKGGACGAPWDDAIPYCLINAAANSLVWHPDPVLEQKLDGYIEWIAAAMEPDGYIYTARKLRPAAELKGDWAYERWVNMRYSHEEFNSGHLIDAACAHYEATGRTNLLAVARKNADLWASLFHPGGLNYLTGHEAIKMALVRLSRATGDRRYLDCARYLLDHRCAPRESTSRGRWQFSDEYFQCHLPVREQFTAAGHQVRAMYLYSAMADIAVETGDPALQAALQSIWTDYTSRKMYLTGGGSPGGVEDFGKPYDLPNRSAYCETCAAVGSVFFNHRMALLFRDAKYADVMERVLLNNALSGIALDGKSFFYVNRLAMEKPAPGATKSELRVAWPGLACCPPNILRLLTSLGSYFYATSSDSVYVNLYAGSQSTVTIGGAVVQLTQETDYPWDGRVTLSVTPSRPIGFGLRLRIPGWVQGHPVEGDLYRYEDATPGAWTVRVNGRSVKASLEQGYAVINREWQAGDRVQLDLPMPVRRVLANEQVLANRHRVAFERGPLVYCAEGADNGGTIDGIVLDQPSRWTAEFQPNLLGGVTVIRGQARRIIDALDGATNLAVSLAPYFSHANRGADDMAVWMPMRFQVAAVSYGGGGASPDVCIDAPPPKNSSDLTVPRVTWWAHKGTTEWIDRRFEQPTRLSSVKVYWFDDTGFGECRVPGAWRLLYRDGKEWKAVRATGEFGVQRDTFNAVSFEPVTTTALRLEVQLQETFSGGILSLKAE